MLGNGLVRLQYGLDDIIGLGSCPHRNQVGPDVRAYRANGMTTNTSQSLAAVHLFAPDRITQLGNITGECLATFFDQ